MSTPTRIPGTELADRMLSEISERHSPTTNYLIGFVASNDPAGMSFQKSKQRAAARANIAYHIAALPEDIAQATAETAINAAATDPSCGGIVIQLPLPAQLDTQKLLDLVPPIKDSDVLSSSAALLFTSHDQAVLPPAARTVEVITTWMQYDLSGKTVAVVGLGTLVGKPIVQWLKHSNIRVLAFDKGFSEQELQHADLVILGTGSYTLNPQILKDGAAVIDFGYRRSDTGLTGDLDTSDEQRLSHLSFYTPTPGGTGPVLIASLLENFALLNR